MAVISLISGVAGFLAPFLTDAVDLFKKRQDHKFSLEMLKLQMQAQRQGADLSLQQTLAEADIREVEALYEHEKSFKNVPAWVDAIRALVRPSITFAFFALFAAIEISALTYMMQQGTDMVDALKSLWTEETKAIFAAVIAFWFGDRHRQRRNRSRQVQGFSSPPLDNPPVSGVVSPVKNEKVSPSDLKSRVDELHKSWGRDPFADRVNDG